MVKFKAELKSVKTKMDKDANQWLDISLTADIESVDKLEELFRMTGCDCAFSVTTQSNQLELEENKNE